MTKQLLSGIAMCGLAASLAQGATVWNPAGNGITPPATGDWSDAANWTGGLPDAIEKAVFNVGSAAECVVTTPVTGMQIVQGDGGDGGLLRIAAGGSITTKAGAWSAIGYNGPAHTIVETGGTYTFSQHAWIGLLVGSTGTLDINGGIVNVGAMLGLGWNGDTPGVGYVNVNDGGTLNLAQLHGDGSSSMKNGSVLDITGTGKVILPGNYTGTINAYVANNSIKGNGIVGNINIDVTNDGGGDITTITAKAIPEPSTLGLLGAFGALAFLRRRRS